MLKSPFSTKKQDQCVEERASPDAVWGSEGDKFYRKYSLQKSHDNCDYQVILVKGHFYSDLPLCSRDEPVFVAHCSPLAMPENREIVVQVDDDDDNGNADL